MVMSVETIQYSKHIHAWTHTQAPAHMSILTIQSLIYTQLKMGSKQTWDSSMEWKTCIPPMPLWLVQEEHASKDLLANSIDWKLYSVVWNLFVSAHSPSSLQLSGIHCCNCKSVKSPPLCLSSKPSSRFSLDRPFHKPRSTVAVPTDYV